MEGRIGFIRVVVFILIFGFVLEIFCFEYWWFLWIILGVGIGVSSGVVVWILWMLFL